MKIEINKFYQNTKGQQVQAGEHDASDLPTGLAQYLVDNGHASVVEEAKAETPTPPKPASTRKRSKSKTSSSDSE